MRELTSAELKCIQLKELEALHEFCEENNLIYYLIGGTLIGSVRHKGYIPWDDDIDVLIPRSDYNKMLNTFNSWAAAKGKSLELISIENCDSYYLASAKIIDKRTILMENVPNAIPIGVYLDVFVLDNMSDDYDKAKKLFYQTKIWRDMLNEKNRSLTGTRYNAKRIIHYLQKFVFLPFSKKFVITRIRKKALQYEADSFSKYVCNVSAPTYGVREIAESTLYSNRLLSEFEGRMFYIPAGYDVILRQNYGDYMQLPPIEKRVTHHGFVAWWR